MGMRLELNTMIVTKNREVRQEENQFLLEKEGYRLYPLDIPIELKKTMTGEASGQAVVKKVIWEGNKTFLTYQLVSLNSTN